MRRKNKLINILFSGALLLSVSGFNVLAEEIDAAVAGDSTIASKVEELETTVGKASGEGAGGLAKDVDDLKTAVGDESTEGSILARIKALEDAT